MNSVLCYVVLSNALLGFFAFGESTSTGEKRLAIQSLKDDIGAGNFTYFRLHRPGCLRIELNSISGDVDLYVSSKVQHPDYESYEMKSETCGLDLISVPSSMSRPVYISLFGHPNHLHSQYELSILEVDDIQVDDYEALVNKYERYYYDEMDYKLNPDGSLPESSERPSSGEAAGNDVDEDDLPLWWKLLLGFLEFGLEVVL